MEQDGRNFHPINLSVGAIRTGRFFLALQVIPVLYMKREREIGTAAGNKVDPLLHSV